MKRLFLTLLLACAAPFAVAASLTTPQQQALKSTALADPIASTYITSPSPDNDRLLADWFNGAGTCVVWKSSVPVADIYEKTSSTGTNWEWTTFISSTTVQERDAWREITRSGGINPALQQVRDGWGKIFGGTGAAPVAQRAHLSAISQRTGTRAESTLATGSCTALSPSVMGFEGSISQGDASLIRSLP